MAHIKEDIRCPNCRKKNRIKIRSAISSDEIDKIIDRSIFKLECLSCHEQIVVDYPMKVIDDNFIIYYTPTEDKEIEEQYHQYMRVCDTFADFKEKLMIMHDELNDIVIEFIKDYSLNQLDEDLRKDIRDIRYDGSNEENLIFYLLGAKQSIGVNRKLYDSILKNCKLKKIKKCVNVDHNTYRKYFKMR